MSLEDRVNEQELALSKVAEELRQIYEDDAGPGSTDDDTLIFIAEHIEVLVRQLRQVRNNYGMGGQ